LSKFTFFLILGNSLAKSTYMLMTVDE